MYSSLDMSQYAMGRSLPLPLLTIWLMEVLTTEVPEPPLKPP